MARLSAGRKSARKARDGKAPKAKRLHSAKVTRGKRDAFADLQKKLKRRTAELAEARAQQTATADILKVIAGSRDDVQPVFHAIADRSNRLLNAFSTTVFTLADGMMHLKAFTPTTPEIDATLQAAFPAPLSAFSWSESIGKGEIYRVIDAELEPEYLRNVARKRGWRSALCVPLMCDGAPIGMIGPTRAEPGPFSDNHVKLMQTFADQAVIAIENVRLFTELRQRTEEVAVLNRSLEARVAEQVEELGRVGRLKRFLAPQLAELIVSQGDEKILESHRREIVVVFCDLRGYTAFTETAEPEEVLEFLREYHGVLGPLVGQYEGTLDQFSGDGIMVFFNDPVPIPDPAARAVKMAVAMRGAASSLIATWRGRGRELGFGVGIAQGYATLGQIGFSERSGYTAIGTVCNVAARLCGEAKDGQILLSQRVNVALKGSPETEQIGALVLKGLAQPVTAYNVPLTTSHPALRVIDGGNH